MKIPSFFYIFAMFSYHMQEKEFLLKARQAHGNMYDYSKVEYKGSHTKVCIICPKHGEFWQNLYSHVHGHGCPKCANEKKVAKRALTNEKFVEKARQAHGNMYDYSKAEYKGSHTKVCIICPKHGEFWQAPSNHINGSGCPECYKEKAFMSKEKFIKKSKELYGNKYDYSKVEYMGNCAKICIICPKHGEFWLFPLKHLNGKGCPLCEMGQKKEEKRIKTNTFIDKAKAVHGNKYDYSKVEYINNKTKVRIICHKHGEFSVKPNCHLSGNGCPKCGIEERAKKRKGNKLEFIEKAKRLYGDKYDYSKVDYKNRHTKVIIKCPLHGEFSIRPYNFLNNIACPCCSKLSKSKLMASTTCKFIKKAKLVHGDKYSYTGVKYTGSQNKVHIICPVHGDFMQRPNDHLNGHGCPKCGVSYSINEDKIRYFLRKNTNYEILQRCRDIISPLELDIYIPEKRVAIEYNGLIWHSEKYGKSHDYHLKKLDECIKRGITLLTIFEDEYKYNETLINNFIMNTLGTNGGAYVNMKTDDIKEVDKKDCDIFMKLYHVQGSAGGNVRLGFFNGGKLIASIIFKEHMNDIWHLQRYAFNYNYNCDNLFSLFLNYFIENYKPARIFYFADRRWLTPSENDIYKNAGFKADKTLPPDFSYYYPKYYGEKRINKLIFKKDILNSLTNINKGMTEKDIIEKLDAYRIWDCGKLRYAWYKEEI